MKTAVPIPDAIFEEAEQLRRRIKNSRSELFSHALAAYLARHAPDRVTESMNKVFSEISPEPDAFVVSAARRVLQRNEW